MNGMVAWQSFAEQMKQVPSEGARTDAERCQRLKKIYRGSQSGRSQQTAKKLIE
jgi:hypothetical protein